MRYRKLNRRYPTALVQARALRKVADNDIHMKLAPEYFYHNLTAAERTSPQTLRNLSNVCSNLVTPEWSREHLQVALKQGHVITISSKWRNQDKVVAFIIFKTRGPKNALTHFIDLICTKPTHQGKGLAGILIKHALTLFIRTAPRADIFLKTWGDKETYYQKFGFRRIHYTPRHTKTSLSITERHRKNTSGPITSTGFRLYYMKFVKGRQQYVQKVRKLAIASMMRRKK